MLLIRRNRSVRSSYLIHSRRSGRDRCVHGVESALVENEDSYDSWLKSQSGPSNEGYSMVPLVGRSSDTKAQKGLITPEKIAMV